MTRLAVAAFVVLAACKQEERGAPSGQTFAAGMEILCNAHAASGADRVEPADRERAIADWIAKNVTNPEALAIRASGADLDAAARRAGLAGCPATAADPRAGAALPEVGDLPLAPVPSGGAVLVVTEEMVTVDGQRVVPVEDGGILQVGPDHRIDRGGYYEVPKVGVLVAGRAVTLELHPRTSYRLLFSLLATMTAKSKGFAIVMRGGGGLGSVPVTLPGMPGPDDDRSMFVRIDEQGPDLAALGAEMRATRQRLPGQRRIVVLAGNDVPLARVAPVLAAAHEVFPEVLLGLGFD